jgi:HAD superfamily hydrolase (TIGR01549 family)
MMQMDDDIFSLSQKKAFLFDYGDTLVRYYKGKEFMPILKKAISNINNYLIKEKVTNLSLNQIWENVKRENYESNDYRVRPLSGRLKRIFNLVNPPEAMLVKMQEIFLEPISSAAKLFHDTIPTLNKLKKDFGVQIIIVSNTPWGAPSNLWKNELNKFELDNTSEFIDLTVFCGDVGWRKPASPIFQYVLDTLKLIPEECIFIGDNPVWDVQGANLMKIDAILLDREQKYQDLPVLKIKGLEELFKFF